MRLLFLFFLLVQVWLSGCSTDPSSRADLYSAIPKSSVVIAETRNIREALTDISQTTIYRDADSLPLVSGFVAELSNLQRILGGDTLRNFLKGRRIVISTSLSGAGKYDMLFLTAADKGFDKMAGRKLAGEYSFKKKEYAGAEIYTFFSDGEEKFSLSSYRDVLLFSKSINLVEEAIRQLNSDFNFKNDPQFSKLYDTANKKDLASIFLKMDELPGWLKNILPLADASFLPRVSRWTELDLQVYDKELLMSGIMLMPENEAFFTSAFQGVSEQQTEAQEIIPASSGLWVAYTFSDAAEYHRKYLEYVDLNGGMNRYRIQTENLDKDIESKLLRWVDNEMGLFYTEGAAQEAFKTAYFKYNDRTSAEETLEELSDSVYIAGYRGYVIRKLRDENLLPRIYGRIFKGFHKPFYIFTDKFVLFSEKEAALKSVINDLLVNKTLGNDESFKTFESKIPSESHIKVVASNPHFLSLFAATLEGRDVQTLEKAKPELINYKWAALQLNIDKNAAFVNFYLLNEPKVQEEVIREWTAVLESPVQQAPQFIYNYTTKKYDVLVQDSNHKIYLLNYNGRILWSKQLDGPVLGNVVLVDAFKNNKLQMVVNTREKLYLIDRLGRDVENFPVTFPEPATAAAGVFNYDDARNYRLIVPAGGQLLNYDISGKPVKGWEFKKIQANLISMPQRFAIDNKDVIVVLDDAGVLHLLNRRGEDRFKKIDGLGDIQTPFYLREGDKLKESELLTTDEDGQMVVIGFNGATDRLYLDKGNPADHLFYFDDRYIFTHDNKLIVKAQDKPWAAEMASDISGRPKAMIFRREFYAAAYSEDAEQISLYDREGNLVKGFPVFAQGPFDMGSLKQDGAINIVTPINDGTLICYRVR